MDRAVKRWCILATRKSHPRMSPRGGVLREPRGFVPGPTLKYLVAAYDYGELRIWDVVYFVIKGRIWELAGGSTELPGAV